MNLADAIRVASQGSPWQPELEQTDAKPAQPAPTQAAVVIAKAEDCCAELDADSYEGSSALSDEDDLEVDMQPRAMPEPPAVTSGNVVRLELFLNGEQMQGLLRSLMAGQHSVLTIREAAAYLRVAPATLADLAESGEVPGIFMDGKWRFPKASLDEWMMLSAARRLGAQYEDTENVA
jgi:excisionase family DNA binding protein